MSTIGFLESLQATAASLSESSLVSVSDPIDLRSQFRFPGQDAEFGNNVLQIHIDFVEPGHARDVLRRMGAEATRIKKSPELSIANYVIGITYPELAACAVRFGMIETRAKSKEAETRLAIQEGWDTYRERNNRPLDSSFGIDGISETAVYLPVEEFVDRFSRFAK